MVSKCQTKECCPAYLAQIAADAVWKNDNHDVILAQSQVLHCLDHGSHGTSTAAAAKNALLGNQTAGIQEGFPVIRLVPSIDRSLVQHIRDKVIADALDLVGLVLVLLIQRLRQSKDTSVRISRNDLDVLLVFPKTPCNSRYGASGTSTSHKRRNLALSLLPDLFTGAIFVCQWVVRVAVLVQDVSVWQLLLQPPRHANVAFRAVECGCCWRSDDFSPQRAQHSDLFGAHLLRQRNDCAVSLDGADQREPDAGVATRGLDERVTRLDATLLFGFFYHAQGDAVFDAAASIEHFELGVDGRLNSQRLGNLVEANHGGIANLLGDGVENDGRDARLSLGGHGEGRGRRKGGGGLL